MSSRAGTRALAVHDWIVRWRWPLFAVLTTHLVLAHYFVLGFDTWDGFTYRIPPVVELVQHGAYNHDKFDSWVLHAFRPFLELANAPFLWLFGQDGLYLAFPLTLYPLCTAFIYLFGRELTRSRTTALYTSAVYISLPLVNAQIFSGHVDWAIPALVGFFLYALLALRRPADTESALRRYGRVALATFLFTNARQQALYLAVVIFVVMSATSFVERSGRSFSLKDRKTLGIAALVTAVALSPQAFVHISNALHHGSPLYPYEFRLLGVKLGDGFPMKDLFIIGGLPEYSLRGFLQATVAAYFVPAKWPYTFFDGRNFGDSIFVMAALLGLPFTWRRANRDTRVLLVLLLALSIAAKDFWQPRYAYGVILGSCLLNGIAVSALLEVRTLAPIYAAAVVVLALHALRPEWDSWRMSEGDSYPRMNCSASKLWQKGNYDIPLFPDLGAHFLIIKKPGNEFTLPLYGRKLSNTIVTSFLEDDVGPSCSKLRRWTDHDPKILLIDDEDLTKSCKRTCIVDHGWRCGAWRLEPESR